jgi:hypothetical protein
MFSQEDRISPWTWKAFFEALEEIKIALFFERKFLPVLGIYIQQKIRHNESGSATLVYV